MNINVKRSEDSDGENMKDRYEDRRDELTATDFKDLRKEKGLKIVWADTQGES